VTEPLTENIPIPVPETPAAPGAGADAEFHVRLGGAMSQMLTASAADARDQAWAREVRIVPITLQAPVVANSVLFANSELGPKTGYVWAVQWASLSGLLAADGSATPPSQVGFYIGQPFPQNQRGAFTYAAPVINPGRTDFILNYGDFVTAQTVAGFPLAGAETVLTLNMQVAVMQTRLLPNFLM
jgi:hypothetical protein